MQQYFVTQPIQPDIPITFDPQQSHHMLRVMRFTSGTQVTVVDPTKQKFLAELHIDETALTGHVIKPLGDDSEFPFTVIVAQGMIKGERFDLFLQKASELGAHRIIPLSTKRTIVKVTSDKEDKKRQRWQKIAMEAAEQARRNQYPHIDEVMTIAQLLEVKANYKLVAYEEDNMAPQGLKGIAKAIQPGETILLVFGCEGGFEEGEIDVLTKHGFLRCGLGPRILRAETASLYALSALSYEVDLSL